MKKKISFVILLTVFILAALSVCAFADSEIINPGDKDYEQKAAELAQKIFSDVDFKAHPELSEVEQFYTEKKYDEALGKYKQIWFSEFESVTDKGILTIVASEAGEWMKNIDAADRLIKENKVLITDRSHISKDLDLGVPGSYNWGLEVDGRNSDGDIFAEYTNMYFTAAFLGAYGTEAPHDTKYLDKWLDIWLDYDMNFNKHGTALELSAQKYVTSGFISCLKLERYNKMRFGVLNEFYRRDKEALMEHMNNVQFGYMISMALDKINQVNLFLIQSNQSIAGCQSAVTLYSALSDFTSAKQRMLLALERFKINTDKSFNKDGGDVEHDMKYNTGYIERTLTILNVLENCNIDVPSYFQTVLSNCVMRMRMLLAVGTSDKCWPNIADSYSDSHVAYVSIDKWNKQYFNDKEIERLISTYADGDEKIHPAYTSIAFPYTGYYIMRKDWTPESQWMFFMGHKWSGGHSCDSNLQVMFFNDGERLLIDSGGNSYGELDIGNYLVNSYAHNTVTVDDMTQAWQYTDDIDITDSAYCGKDPVDGIWHTNDRFDFVTGTFTDGYTLKKNTYNNNVPTKQVTDVTHSRSVINDKENEIAVVYDRIDSKLPHTINVNWNYAKKFDNYGTVFADSDEKVLRTTLNDKKAGIDIYNFTQNDISYEVNCGEYGDKNGQITSGWNLPTYGIDYKPNVHVSTYFKGNCGQQGIISLLAPKTDNKSTIKTSKSICNDQGFEIEKTDGTKITCVGGQKDSTKIDEAGFKLSAKLFYFVEKPDGSKWGMVSGASTLIYGGKRYTFSNNNFEFKVENGKVIYVSAMKVPTDFRWTDTDNGAVPSYGETPDSYNNIKY